MDVINEWINKAASVEIGDYSIIKVFAFACIGSLIIGFLGRFIFGKRSNLNHAVSSTLGILSLYVLGILLYGYNTSISSLLDFLPFISVSQGNLVLFPILNADFPIICSELVRMLVLAFLMNLLDIWIPQGKNIFSWILFRCLTLALAIVCLSPIMWAITTYLPEVFQTMAPTVLLVIVVAALLLGSLKIFVGLALATVNPVIGALYTFFFANIVGKQISKAVLTTLLLTVFVIVLDKMGYVVLSLAALTLPILIPIILILLLFWYIVGHLL